MIISVLDLLKASMRKIGVISKSESLPADEAQDALQSLNMMMGTMSVKSLMVLGAILESFTLTVGKNNYTIGPAAIGFAPDFNTDKPSAITSAFIRDSSNYDHAMDCVTREEYNWIPDKSTQGRPNTLCFDEETTQQDPAFGTIYLYYTPDQAYTLFIGQQKPLTEFTALTDIVTFHPAYYELLLYNLAIRLYREYHEHGRPIPSDIVELASAAVRTVESMNAKKTTVAKIGIPGVGGGYNVYTDGQ